MFKRITSSLLICLMLLVIPMGCAPTSLNETTETTEATETSEATTTSEADLVARLETPAALPNGETVPLSFTLTNNTDADLYVLKWYTPLEGIAGEIFRVERDGQPVPYQGILATRAAPSAEDYILLEPGASASADVDLATAYDFSQAGAYTIEFIPPRISHVAKTEAEMATSLDDLGPVQMPSNQVTVEIGDSAVSSTRLTSDKAEQLVRDYLRSQHPNLNPDTRLPMPELPMPELWEHLPVQIFRVTEGPFARETFLIHDDTVLQLGTAFGGIGVNSLQVSDLDQDGNVELLFAYSFGSGIHQTRIGMYAPAYDDDRIYETETAYLGDAGLFKEDTSNVAVRAVESDEETSTLRYLDTLGHLAIQQHEGQIQLVWQIAENLPQDVLQNIVTASPTPTPDPTPTTITDKPDENALLFGLIYQSADALWHINADGEAVKLLEHLGDDYAGPAISPDGTQVVYAEADDIWLADIATGERRNLTQTPERRECCAQWWPSRPDSILFDSWPAEASGPNMGFATLIRSDGTGYQVLDDEEPAFTQPAPGPDGQTVAYDRAAQPWLHRADTGPEPLSFDLTAYEPLDETPIRVVSPGWSPDGTQLAWVVGGDFAALGGWRLGIGVFDLQAGTTSLLHPYEPVGQGGWPPAPVWSPDGRWLVFDTWAQDGDETGLWVAHPNGEEEHHLDCGVDRTWSPDGRWLACASVPPGYGARLIEAETWASSPLDLPADARIVEWIDPTNTS